MADDDETASSEDAGDEIAIAPAGKANSATQWLKLIADGERAFADYNTRCDNIDRLYANLARLAGVGRDKQMQLFWANMQVLAPSIYSRPPVPVVVPRFKDRKPIPRIASELLERATLVAFELGDIDSTMRLVRDDLARLGRGVLWQRYEAQERGKNLTERVCIEHKGRKDFLHDPARKWAEVDWVAAASYLTRSEMRKRFSKTSGRSYQDATYSVRKDAANQGEDKQRKARVWELWCKSANKVVWVADGCDAILDEGSPHLELDGFFPCPRPAFGTLQPETLIPVPDVMQYRDQLDEINELTTRIAALTDAVKVRGFYPAGAGEIGDAVEAAVKTTDDRVILIPVSNWAANGGGALKDTIIWLPLDMIVSTIAKLVELRQQMIADVYQVSGLSDIMRGSTDPNETLGAQELKSQYGSIRIRDMRDELVRIARDATRNSAEIMAEDFSSKTLLDMSQLDLPTDGDIGKQVAELEGQAAKIEEEVNAASQDPEVQALAKQDPQKVQAIIAEVQQKAQQLAGQIGELKKTVTIEQVMKLLRDQRIRPFMLDIETDSTITPDENAQTERAAKYISSMTGLLQQAIPAVQMVPQVAPFVSDIIKFANSQFRVGREFEQTVEEFTDQMKSMASAPKPPAEPPPETIRAQAEAQRTGVEAQRAQVDNAERMQALQSKAADDDLMRRIRAQEAKDASAARLVDIKAKEDEANARLAAINAKTDADRQAHEQNMEKGRLDLEKLAAEIAKIKAATPAVLVGGVA